MDGLCGSRTASRCDEVTTGGYRSGRVGGDEWRCLSRREGIWVAEGKSQKRAWSALLDACRSTLKAREPALEHMPGFSRVYS